MTFTTIGVMSPGDMGQAVAARLREGGVTVATALDGRSPRTRALAAEAGLVDCGSLAGLVDRCDLILSIIDPGGAMELAAGLSEAMTATGRTPLIADCNAIAPATKRLMQTIIERTGAQFIDGGIIGPPPRGAGRIRLYVSGPNAAAMTALRRDTIDVRVVSDRIGDAAAVKMCYGGVTKGLIALGAELLMAAETLGVADVLDRELQESQKAIHDWLLKSLGVMPPKAYRWVPETEEIAATFEAAGLTPRMMLGSADMYVMIADTALGRESPEAARAAARPGRDVIAGLAASRQS